MLSQAYSAYSYQPAADLLSKPRAIVLINGISVLFQSLEVMTTTFYMSDTYNIVIPLSEQPSIFNENYLFSTSSLSVKIYMGFPINPDAFSTSDLDLMIVGDCDNLDYDPIQRIVTISGRDLTSRFIDTKTYEKYSNKTPSEIAIILAKKYGLNPIVTPTKEAAGIFFTYQNTLMTRETTEWDLLCFLAQQEDFVVYVEQNNLIFKPRSSVSSVPYVLNFQKASLTNASPVFRGMNLKFSRSMTLAKDVVVKVRVPYNPQTGNAFTVKATSRNKVSLSEGLQVFTYTIPGLSKSQALAKAQQLARDITIHEIKLSAELPGDNILKKDSIIKVAGVDNSIDQTYYADQVTRTMNAFDYRMQISAKNHNVDNEILL